MATVGRGNQPLLLIVDVQVGVMANAWQAERVISNIVKVVERARRESVPVIWVQHADDESQKGTDAWQLAPELQPVSGELRLYKRYNLCFEETSLEAELARLGATHIVLAGAATNWCIRATAYAALERGYDLTLVSDAHTTATSEFPDGKQIPAAHVIDELNLAMTWLNYPGRSNGTETTQSVDFFAPATTRERQSGA